MRIGVLGPLRVEVSSHPVEPGGPRPRRLLAAGDRLLTEAFALWR